ncbi:hypothetical protein BDW71DRAFT_172261 [Aspergillus fruticulosus]
MLRITTLFCRLVNVAQAVRHFSFSSMHCYFRHLLRHLLRGVSVPVIVQPCLATISLGRLPVCSAIRYRSVVNMMIATTIDPYQ